jgi:uncharacterized protein YbjQ (UPF0145 family)
MPDPITNCSNCNADLRIHSKPLSENKIKVINYYHEPKSPMYCTKCGQTLYQKYKIMVMTEKDRILAEIESLIDAIPVITAHTPLNWDYDILELVTSQSVTGTGVTAELSAAFSDFFGTQSNRYNNKLKGGEKLCLAQLRKQAIDLGGNAIIATDIDYSEVGGMKGMLMVCIAGTAVRLKNTVGLGEARNEKINHLLELLEKVKPLAGFNYFEI